MTSCESSIKVNHYRFNLHSVAFILAGLIVIAPLGSLVTAQTQRRYLAANVVSRTGASAEKQS